MKTKTGHPPFFLLTYIELIEFLAESCESLAKLCKCLNKKTEELRFFVAVS